MGRNIEMTEEILRKYYSKIVDCVKSHDKPIHLAQLSEETGIKTGRISKALQWGRREFDNGEIPIRDYVMASPLGYFCPKESNQLCAYVAQVYKDANSRLKTTTPIYNYAAKHYPEKLRLALTINSYDEDMDPDDPALIEMQPWGVWNNLMN